MTPHSTSSVTLANVLNAIEQAPCLPAIRRREMTSALHTICRVLKREPHLVPASTVQLQGLIRDALPAAIGVTAKRWRNCKSLLRSALALIDPAALPARSRDRLSPAWRTLIEIPEASPMRRGIARFSKWCSANGTEPAEVDQDVYELFYLDIAEHCLLRNPRETQQVAGHAWNDAAAAVPGWPTVELVIENRRRNPSLPWDAFPPTLSAQIDEYLSARANDDLRFDVSPVVFRPETVKSKRLQLRQYVTALVESGVAPQNLSTLADLVAPHHVRAGLHVLYKRAGDTKTTRMYSMATLLLGLARHQVKAEPETIKQLAVYCANVCPKKTGMVDKNRERLRPFKDPRQLDIFLALPGRLLTAARALAEPTKAEARLAQHAIALEIFTVAPLRISNIAALEVGRTLILTETTGHIVIPRAEVKNDIDIEIPLPRTTLKMIKLYLKRFHPLLAPLRCAMLFPSADGGHKRSPVLGTQLRQRIRGECGLDFNAHLFRHLAAYIFLRENPGQYGTVKLLLGHKDIDTTINTYCGLEADAAFASYASIIGARRAAVQGDWA